MKELNKGASKVMEMLVASLDADGYVKIDNSGSKSIMPVVVERLESYDIGTIYSVAHYYQQNGDAMRDPEMTFLKHLNGKWYPCYFLQDNIGLEENSLFYDLDLNKWKIRKRVQADHARFANTWMKNIKEQQRL
jgi:hypothetical protein